MLDLRENPPNEYTYTLEDELVTFLSLFFVPEEIQQNWIFGVPYLWLQKLLRRIPYHLFAAPKINPPM